LHENIDEVQSLANEESEGIEVVAIQILREVIQENLLAFLLAFFVDNRAVEIEHEHFDATTFPCFPQVTWNIKANGCVVVCVRTKEREIFGLENLILIKETNKSSSRSRN
jgi:hypothetical protein